MLCNSNAIRHRLKAPTKTKDLSATNQDICEVVESWFTRRFPKDELADIATAFLEAQKEDPKYSMRDLKAYCRRFFAKHQFGVEPTGFMQLAEQTERRISLA